jgi:hypothetical protein
MREFVCLLEEPTLHAANAHHINRQNLRAPEKVNTNSVF